MLGTKYVDLNHKIRATLLTILRLPGEGLCPKTPLKKAGMRMLPPISEPTPITEQAAARVQPSPPRQNAKYSFKIRKLAKILFPWNIFVQI